MTSTFDDAKTFEYSAGKNKYSEEERLHFINEFPESELLSMPIGKYADVNSKDTFCYWLEFKGILQGVGGGNASKFGIYRSKHDNQYYKGTRGNKLPLAGQELEIEFSNLKKSLVDCIKCVDNADFEAISKMKSPLWDMVLIKILCLYRPNNFLNIGKVEVLQECAKALEISSQNVNPIVLNNLCLTKLREQPEFRSWDKVKLMEYIWHKFNKVEMNYWIFQCNPNDYDFESAIRNGEIDSWTVNAHKEKIKPEDRVILWLTGKKSGCYALAEVTSEPKLIESATDDRYWKIESNSQLAAGIQVTHNLIDNPILLETIKNTKGFENFKAGNQGTNFSATEKEYELLLKLVGRESPKKYWIYAPGENARFWEEFYAEGIMAIGWEELGDLRQYKNQDEVAAKLKQLTGSESSKNNDSLANYQFTNDLSVGDIVFPKKGRNEFLGYGIVESDYYFDTTRKEYKSCRRVSWKKKGVWVETEGSIVLKTLTNVTDYKTSIPGYSSYVDRISKLIGIDDQSLTIIKIPKNMALNQILYGPPGTGKTYNSIGKSVEIVNGSKSDSHKENKMVFDELRSKGQIEFVTFHQNYSYEDFVVGLKPDIEFEQLRFKSHKGIFYEIARKARENFEASREARSQERDFETVFQEIISPLESGNEIEIQMKSKISFWITDVSTHSISFRKASGGTQHTLSIETLKDLVSGVRGIPSGLSSYYMPLVDLVKQKQKITGTIETRRNFVLVIDEINRANISKVFGELITLLEDDKRLGEDNELKVTLPNGEKDFGIPPNLFIIGTMNTADKSIALIDIALRRRFEFIPYYPNYSVIEKECADLLRLLNESIFEKKKSADYLIGHAYFMKNQSIEAVLRHKILPLLMEYFAGKTQIVTDLFSSSDWKVEYNSMSFEWHISQS